MSKTKPFDYKGFSEDELLALCNTHVTRNAKKYWTAEVYSFGKWIRDYAYYPSWLPLCCYTDHGPGRYSKISKHEIETDAPVQFYHARYFVDLFKKISNKPCYCMFSPFVWCRKVKKIAQLSTAHGTLAFPSHSTASVAFDYSVDQYIDMLLGLPEKFHPVCVCLHMHDIHKGTHKQYLKRGIPVYTAGSNLDDRFSERWYDIAKNFRYTTSQTMGSYTYYAVEMGIPFFLYGDAPSAWNYGDSNLALGPYDYRHTGGPYLDGLYSVFGNAVDSVTAQQKEIAESSLGIGYGIDRLQMAKILYIAYLNNEGWLKLAYYFFRKIYRLFTPDIVRDNIHLYREKFRENALKKKIINHIISIDSDDEAIEYLRHNQLKTLPYAFSDQYEHYPVEVLQDIEKNMKYVLYEGKKLYFKKNWDEFRIKEYYTSLLIEQDIDSPHRYELPDSCVSADDIVVDAGAAEGMFALSVIDKASKIYLFEADSEWIAALNLTFAPYKNKVVIVNKFISDENIGESITLDGYFDNDAKINFLKADIEGAELGMLNGAKHLLATNNNIRMAISAYHREQDAKNLSEKVKEYGFVPEFSRGFMLYESWIPGNAPSFYVRKGLVRAKKV